MPRLVRQVVAIVALLALVGGAAYVQPCVDDDDDALACSCEGAMSCPDSDRHGDPATPIHSCDCLCHVPAVAVVVATSVRSDAPLEPGAVPVEDPLSPGYAGSLFRPPRA